MVPFLTIQRYLSVRSLHWGVGPWLAQAHKLGQYVSLSQILFFVFTTLLSVIYLQRTFMKQLATNPMVNLPPWLLAYSFFFLLIES